MIRQQDLWGILGHWFSTLRHHLRQNPKRWRFDGSTYPSALMSCWQMASAPAVLAGGAMFISGGAGAVIAVVDGALSGTGARAATGSSLGRGWRDDRSYDRQPNRGGQSQPSHHLTSRNAIHVGRLCDTFL